MINKLLNRKSIARTSSAPGKTATVNFYNLGFCRFADLPGYGYAKVSRQEKLRWAELVEGYFASVRKIVLVVQIIDIRRPPTQDDAGMVRFLREKNLPFLLAASKSDKLNRAQREESLRMLEQFCAPYGAGFLPFSAQNGEGVPMLKERILLACGASPQAGPAVLFDEKTGASWRESLGKLPPAEDGTLPYAPPGSLAGGGEPPPVSPAPGTEKK